MSTTTQPTATAPLYLQDRTPADSEVAVKGNDYNLAGGHVWLYGEDGTALRVSERNGQVEVWITQGSVKVSRIADVRLEIL